MFSINNAPLILKPLSTYAWLWDNKDYSTNFLQINIVYIALH